MIEHQKGNISYLQFNLYQQFPEIIHGIVTRQGGYSDSPYGSLNVSWSGGDNIDKVIRNRLLALQTLGIETYPCATLWQVHGADVSLFDKDTWDDWRHDWPHRSYFINEQELIWTIKPRRKADAIITNQTAVAFVLSFADCVPLLFCDPIQRVIGIAHAGWRGTARGIALATVEAMSEHFSCRPQDIHAGIGPAIGPCCYEVSEQVQQLFQGDLEAQFIAPATWGGVTDWAPTQYTSLVRESAIFSLKHLPDRASLRLDLAETNRNQLLMAALLPEHIELSGICTSCNKARFFSHRGEHGKTGRFPVIIALRRP